MNIELRKIQHVERLSEETNCYVAQVWVDGKHIVDVSNEGHGGPDNQYPAKGYTYKDIEALNERCKSEFGQKTHHDITIEQDLEAVCGDLLTEWLIERDIKKALSRQVCFTLHSKRGIFSVNLTKKGHKFSIGEVVTALRSRHGSDLEMIVNQLPIKQAVEFWKGHE